MAYWPLSGVTYATADDLGITLPPEVADNYHFAIDLVAGPPPGFEITFTPKESGNLVYACGMDMIKGTIAVQPAR